jgi:hypothetical protein
MQNNGETKIIKVTTYKERSGGNFFPEKLLPSVFTAIFFPKEIKRGRINRENEEGRVWWRYFVCVYEN